MAVPVQVREKVSFHRDVYGTLVKDLIRQKNTGEFCDVVLRINGRCFYAHKAVLAAASSYFRSMFTSHMREEASADVDLSESLLLENENSFKHILNFMYSGDIEITLENAEDFMRIADFLLLEEVKDYCRQYFLEHGNLNLANCLCVSVLAEHHNLPTPAEVARNMVKSRFHDYLAQSDDILDLPESVFSKLIRDKDITSFTSSDCLATSIMRWVKHDLVERQSNLSKLLSLVHLQSLKLETVEALLYHAKRDVPLVEKLSLIEKSLNAEGACSKLVNNANFFDEINGEESQMVPQDGLEPVILAVTCNTILKFLQICVYNIAEEGWYNLPINGHFIMQNIPARLTVCSAIHHESMVYMFLSYNLPYPADMLRINILALDLETGEHKLMNFRHRYNTSECCQTTLTDDRSVPPAMAYCNDCLCIIGNVNGTGQVYVCDPTSQTYMCYAIFGTRFISLARVACRDNRFLYVWCRHRFGHEEYCVNKEVTFTLFDVKNKCFCMEDLPPPPGLGYGEFADLHVLCLEKEEIVLHTPGKSSLLFDEQHRQWITYSRKLPAYHRQKIPVEMPYHGYEVSCYSSRDVYVFENPTAYTTGLSRLDEHHTGGVRLIPPPQDGISLAVPAMMAHSFLYALPPSELFDDAYTCLIHNKGGPLDYDTEGSGTAHSENSDTEDECNDGYEYDEDIYGYFDEYEY